MTTFRLTLLTIALCIFSEFTFAQIEHGGTPLGLLPGVFTPDIAFYQVPDLNIHQLQMEDEVTDQYKDIPWRFGAKHEVEVSSDRDGMWEEFPNGDRVWRYGCFSPGAVTLNFVLNKFVLPKGAKLFIYNPDNGHFIGSFTSENNKESGILGTTFIHGDKAVFEYYEPFSVKGEGQIALETITHGYRHLSKWARDLGDSGGCNNNVVCPEGDNWRDQIRSVAIIMSNNNAVCTGALVNNTCEDETPYFLTANHCLGGNSNSWVFMFNWESPDCVQNQNGPTNFTVSGSSQKASSAGSDFGLLELSSTPPSSYNVYYAGWDKSGNTPTSQVGIHHPSGDVKKISFDNDPAVSTSWQNAAVWNIENWEDGTTEGGSSGSPLFNENGNVIGQLYGGSASCSSISDDYYGQFHVSWTGGGAPSNSLSSWLDGCATNVDVLYGFDPNQPVVATDAQAFKITEIEDMICGSQFSPEITIKNRGSDTLTSVMVYYSLDGASPTSIFWSGSLATNQTDVVSAGSFTVSSGPHVFNAFVAMPNNSADMYSGNDSLSFNFSSLSTGIENSLEIVTDYFGSQVSWEVSDTSGNTLFFAGGPYGDGGNTFQEPLCLDGGCYDFTIYDSGNDGLASGSGQDGSYIINSPAGDTLVFNEGNSYTNQQTTRFCVIIDDIKDLSLENGLMVFPNPSKGEVIHIWTSKNERMTSLQILDFQGREVSTVVVSGRKHALNTRELSSGLYFLKARMQDGRFEHRRIIVEH